MATFSNKPEAQLAPNYTGASQGIHASPNTAIGTLFEGLASALDTGIKEADRSTQEAIRNELFDQVDSIRSEFGVDSATEFQEDAGSPRATPAALNDAGRHLQGLQAQYIRGGLKESHYWARMNAMVRQIRGRYPGYRAEIDTMVSGIVGTNPANALRSSLFNEWEDAANASNQTQKDYNNLVDSLLKKDVSDTGRTYLPMDFFSRKEGGDPYSMTELQAYANSVQAEEGQIVAARTQMALENEQNTLQTSRAEKQFRTEATGFVNNLLADTTSSLGRSYHDISVQIQEAQEASMRGDPQSQLVVQTLVPQIAQLQQGILTALNQKFTESWNGDPSASYAAHLSNEQRQAIISTAMQPVQILQDAILNEDYGVVDSVAAYLQAGKTEETRRLIETIPALNVMQSLKEVAGPDVMGLYMQLQPQMQVEINKVLLDYAHNQAGLGQGNITAAMDQGQSANADKEYYDGLIKTWQNTINEAVSGKLSPEIIANNVEFMFGQEALQVLGRMTPDSRYTYFKKVASPQVTQQMLKLKQGGDVDSWNTYQNWVAGSFITLFQSAVKDLPGTVPDTTGVSVVWDSTTNGFKVTGNPALNTNQSILSGPGFSIPNPTAGIETQVSANLMQNKVANLNAAIRVVAPIIEANGENTGQAILELLQQMGYDPGRVDNPDFAQGALFSGTAQIDKMLGDALVNGLKGMGVIGDTSGTKFESGAL